MDKKDVGTFLGYMKRIAEALEANVTPSEPSEPAETVGGEAKTTRTTKGDAK